MANNYLQFSEIITHLTPGEEAWLRAQLQTIAVHNGQETEIANEDDVAPHAEWIGPRFLRDDEGYDADFGRYDFQCEFEDYPDWGRHLWLYAEEFGEPNEVCLAGQEVPQAIPPRPALVADLGDDLLEASDRRV